MLLQRMRGANLRSVKPISSCSTRPRSRPKLPGTLEIAWPFLTWFTNRVFDEDREIVEMEQAAYEAQGGFGIKRVFRQYAN
jgi:hypothetical protein